jgi:hypothetical protein
MDNSKTIELLFDIEKQMDKITLEDFLNVMSIVGKKIKSERLKIKETNSFTKKEIDQLVSLYENIKNYLFDIFSADENNLSSVEKLSLLHEKIKKYLSLNDDIITKISPQELEEINKQCSIINFDDIDKKINDIKENSSTTSIDDFDAIYLCVENTLELLVRAVGKIPSSAEKESINRNVTLMVEIIKQFKKDIQIFNKKKDNVSTLLPSVINSDMTIPLLEKVTPMIEIGKIYDKIVKQMEKINNDFTELKSLVENNDTLLDELKKTETATGLSNSRDTELIKQSIEQTTKNKIEAIELYTEIEKIKKDIELIKNEAYDNLAGIGLIKYDDYNNYKFLAGSDEKKMLAPLSDEMIRLILNNNIRLLANVTLEELYYIIDKVKNYLFSEQHFISKGVLGIQWNFNKNDLKKYMENPKQGVNNSSWPSKDINVPPLPNPVQIIALYLTTLVNISYWILKDFGVDLRDGDNIRTVLKTFFVDNNTHKNKKVNMFKYDGKDYSEAIKANSGCNFYIGHENLRQKPQSQYYLTGGTSHNNMFFTKYQKYKQKYINARKSQ